jgi:hypothetical protein
LLHMSTIRGNNAPASMYMRGSRKGER